MQPNYDRVGVQYALRERGIDPSLELFDQPRQNEVVNASSGCFSCLRNSCFILGMPWTLCCAVKKVTPMHDKIVEKCGVVSEVLRVPGPYFINPCCTETYDLFMGLKTEELNNLPINDSHGNPLIISAQFVYRVSDSLRASYTAMSLHQFLKDQAGSTLRVVCGHYPFDVEDEHSICLRKHSSQVDNNLRETLQLFVNQVGVTIESFRMTRISVEQHMEKLLLARQEAQAELIARKTIADGSAGIIQELVRNYNALGINLSKKELNRFGTQLTLILVNHGHTTLNLFEGSRQLTPPELIQMSN